MCQVPSNHTEPVAPVSASAAAERMFSSLHRPLRGGGVLERGAHSTRRCHMPYPDSLVR